MAGRKVNIKQKMKASSILEVVVAMVVIIVVFGIAMTIYANVLRMTLSVKQLRAQAVLQDLFAENPTFTEGIVHTDDLTITKKVIPYQDQPGLVIVRLEAFDVNNKSVAVSTKIQVTDE
jgi:hypothetical protein